MSRSAKARELGARLAESFERDRALAVVFNDAQARLRAASASLWDGLHPDALGPLYDERTPAPVPLAFAASRACCRWPRTRHSTGRRSGARCSRPTGGSSAPSD